MDLVYRWKKHYQRELNMKRKRPQTRPNRQRSIGRFEALESRHMLTAEGSPFNFNSNFDTSGLGGTISSQIEWGDGTNSAGTVRNAPQDSRLKIRFDYSLDTSGFFDSQQRRNLLQTAADAITSKLTDSLTRISVSAGNTWRATFQNPSTGQSLTYNNLTINANELLVYVGARDIPDGVIGYASRGGTGGSFTSQAELDNVRSRGQSGALRTPPTDFGPWGGSLSFDNRTKWHFGATTAGLDPDEFDFMTIAQHEIMHILGFGTSPSFDALLSGNNFRGTNAQRVAGVSPVPMTNSDHFSSIDVDGRTPLMDSRTGIGKRVLVSALDFAALQDLGWNVANQRVNVSGTHTYGDNAAMTGTVTLRGSSYGELRYPFSIRTTNVAPTLTKPENISQIVGSPIVFSRLGVFTDPGFGMPQASPPSAESFTYSINWGDGTPVERGNATVSRLGIPGRETQGFFAGQHTYTAPGVYRVVLRVTDDDGGFSEQSFTATITGVPELSIQADKLTFAENAGAGAATLTITRAGFPTNVALPVTLTSSQPSKLTVASTVTFPVGATQITVPLRAVDNNILDGTTQVSIVASANGVRSDALFFDVLDHETIRLAVDRISFPENAGAGAALLGVQRSNTNIDQPLTVQLRSSDTTELTLPQSVTIPAGQSSTTVGINAVDDNLFDNTQFVEVTAQAAGYEGGRIELQVTDYQPIQLVVGPNVVLREEDPTSNSTTIDVKLRSPAPAGGVVVQLSSTPSNQLTFPPMVTIPAGQTTVKVPVQVIDDFAPQGDRIVKLSASGNGLVSALVDIAISDEDEAIWTNLNNIYDIDGDGALAPIDALAIINSLNLRGPRRLDPVNDSDELFVDPDKDGWITPLDALMVVNALNQRRFG